MTDLLLHYGTQLCWALALAGAGRFAAERRRDEPDRRAALLALAAVALPAALLPFLLPPRGGYDNEHDFECLGTVFFTLKPRLSLFFKEYSPLFTDGVTDLLSGRSLEAILWKNRLLPALSACALFGALRRLGASLAVAAAGTALLFLNFLSLLNASAFSTTSSIMFVWTLSLLALADAHAAPEPGAWRLAWTLSTTALVAGARFEFLPVNFLLLAAVIAAKPPEQRRALLRPARLLLLLAGACLLAAWISRSAALDPARQLVGAFGPARNLASELGSRNLSVLAGLRPAYPPPGGNMAPRPAAADHALAWLFVLACAACAFAAPARRRSNLLLAAPLLAWALYFSAIFWTPDFYPLHFMRHQLYFFTPFALLAALGLHGLEGAAARRPSAARAFPWLLAALTAAYAGLNARAALSYNGELRTNDRELAFLAGARRDWPAGCAAVYPRYSRLTTRDTVIAKYFPGLPERGGTAPGCLLKYASPESFVFTDPAPPKLAQAPLLPGPAPAWREAAFPHAFYTVFRAGRGAPPRIETTAPVPLRIGFYPPGSPRDRAYLLASAGLRAFGACDRDGAGSLLRAAAKEDPACLNCAYFAALGEAWRGRGREAGAALDRLRNESPGGLADAHLALAASLLAGDASAEAAVSDIETADPGFFLGARFRAGLRCGQLPSPPIK